jgi:S1-C subfamily serine protease
MKQLLPYIFGLIFAGMPCAHAYENVSKLDDSRKLVAKVRVERPGQSAETASAVLVGWSPERMYFVTAFHVIDRKPQESGPLPSSIELRILGKPEAIRAEAFDQYDAGCDFGVISIPLIPELSAIKPTYAADPAPGAVLEVIGQPSWGDWSVSRQAVTNEKGAAGKVQQFSYTPAGLADGFSGGGVFAPDGALLGIHTGINVNYAIGVKSTYILEKLQFWQIPPNVIKPRLAAAPHNVTISVAPHQGILNVIDKQAYNWIEPGAFVMGCQDTDYSCNTNEKPAHVVHLSHGYWMAQAETTVRAYQRFVEVQYEEAPRPVTFHQTPSDPVVTVSWKQADAFCRWAKSRLPTEAEWEYAATVASSYEPDIQLDEVGRLNQIAWFRLNSENRTHPVANKFPNASGLFDMLGNVWEWTADWYDSYKGAEVTDPKGPGTGKFRVMRGGAWNSVPAQLRYSGRLHSLPDMHDETVGFRCVCDHLP